MRRCDLFSFRSPPALLHPIAAPLGPNQHVACSGCRAAAPKGKCPECRVRGSTPARLARTLVNLQTIRCSWYVQCGVTTSVDQIGIHEASCPHKPALPAPSVDIAAGVVAAAAVEEGHATDGGDDGIYGGGAAAAIEEEGTEGNPDAERDGEGADARLVWHSSTPVVASSGGGSITSPTAPTADSPARLADGPADAAAHPAPRGGVAAMFAHLMMLDQDPTAQAEEAAAEAAAEAEAEAAQVRAFADAEQENAELVAVALAVRAAEAEEAEAAQEALAIVESFEINAQVAQLAQSAERHNRRRSLQLRVEASRQLRATRASSSSISSSSNSDGGLQLSSVAAANTVLRAGGGSDTDPRATSRGCAVS